MSGIAGGSLQNLIFSNFLLLVGLGITVVTARLGLEDRGSFFLFTLIAMLITTTASGLGISAAYRISRRGETPVTAVWSALVLGFIIGIMLMLVILIAAILIPNHSLRILVLLAPAAPFLLVAPTAGGAYLGLGRMFPLNLCTIAPSAMALALMGVFAVISPPLNLDKTIQAWVAGQVLAAAGVLVMTWSIIGFHRPSIRELGSHARFAAQIGVTNLAGLLNRRVNFAAIQLILGTAATGIYSITVAVAELPMLVSAAVATASYGRIGSEGGLASARLVVRIVHLNWLLLLVVSPILYLLSVFAIPAFLGEAYRPSLLPLAVLLPGVILFSSASAFSAYFTNQLGRPMLSAAIAVVSTAICLILSWLLTPRFGIEGAAVAASVTYAAGMVFAAGLFVKTSGLGLKDLVVFDWRQIAGDVEKVISLVRGRLVE
jgi:O-antigen/teichoic acid export membrane protein